MSSMAPRVIAIEGNIGAGKSTLLEALRGQGYAVVPEPLGEWLNCEGTNLLGAYYEKPKRWSLTFQMWCLRPPMIMISKLVCCDLRPVVCCLL